MRKRIPVLALIAATSAAILLPGCDTSTVTSSQPDGGSSSVFVPDVEIDDIEVDEDYQNIVLAVGDTLNIRDHITVYDVDGEVVEEYALTVTTTTPDIVSIQDDVLTVTGIGDWLITLNVGGTPRQWKGSAISQQNKEIREFAATIGLNYTASLYSRKNDELMAAMMHHEDYVYTDEWMVNTETGETFGGGYLRLSNGTYSYDYDYDMAAGTGENLVINPGIMADLSLYTIGVEPSLPAASFKDVTVTDYQGNPYDMVAIGYEEADALLIAATGVYGVADIIEERGGDAASASTYNFYVEHLTAEENSARGGKAVEALAMSFYMLNIPKENNAIATLYIEDINATSIAEVDEAIEEDRIPAKLSFDPLTEFFADIIGAKKSYTMTSWAFVGVGVSYTDGSTGYITVDDAVELYPNDPNVLAYANEIYETAAMFNFQTDDYWTTYVDSDETLSVREDGAYLGYKNASDGNIYGYSGLNFDQETGTVGEAPANVSLVMEDASIWDAGISTDLVDTTGQVVGTIPAPFTVADQTAELHAGIDYSLAETDIDLGDGVLAHVALPTAYGESEDWIRDMIALHPLTGPDMAYNLTYNLVGSNGLTWKDFINSITIEIVDGSIYIDIMMYGMGGIYIPDLASYAVNAELHWITMIDSVGETVVPDVGAIVPPVTGGGETGGSETSEPSAN